MNIATTIITGAVLITGTIAILAVLAWATIPIAEWGLKKLGAWREALLFVQERYRARIEDGNGDKSIEPCQSWCAYSRISLRKDIDRINAISDDYRNDACGLAFDAGRKIEEAHNILLKSKEYIESHAKSIHSGDPEGTYRCLNCDEFAHLAVWPNHGNPKCETGLIIQEIDKALNQIMDKS